MGKCQQVLNEIVPEMSNEAPNKQKTVSLDRLRNYVDQTRLFLLYLEPHSAIGIENEVIKCGSSHNLGLRYKVSPIKAEQLGTLFTDK